MLGFPHTRIIDSLKYLLGAVLCSMMERPRVLLVNTHVMTGSWCQRHVLRSRLLVGTEMDIVKPRQLCLLASLLIVGVGGRGDLGFFDLFVPELELLGLRLRKARIALLSGF